MLELQICSSLNSTNDLSNFSKGISLAFGHNPIVMGLPPKQENTFVNSLPNFCVHVMGLLPSKRTLLLTLFLTFVSM